VATTRGFFAFCGVFEMLNGVAAEYRVRADRCQRQAEKSLDPTDKAYWVRFVEQWLALASAAERHPTGIDHHARAGQGHPGGE
jgi:hypothetical protein